MLQILFVLLIVLAVVALIAIVAAALLGLGTLLALLFPVTAWQAPIVVMGATAGVAWFFRRLLAPPIVDLPDLDDLDDELAEEPPIVVLPEFPLNRPRGRRRRKR